MMITIQIFFAHLSSFRANFESTRELGSDYFSDRLHHTELKHNPYKLTTMHRMKKNV